MKKRIRYRVLLAPLLLACMMATCQQKKSPIFNHLALYVKDLEKSTWFYNKVLGLDSISEPFHDGRHTWLRIGKHSQLHLISGATGEKDRDKNTHLCFSVPVLEDMITRLEKFQIAYGNWAGDSKTPTLRTDGVKQIYLKDPDGYWVEINDDKY